LNEFSPASKEHLSGCHDDLIALFTVVILHFDCAVIEGFRNKEDQDKAYKAGVTKLEWPNSKHNKYPARAVDVIPYPIDWTDLKRMYFFGGFVMGIAKSMGINIRWGGDWDRDTEVMDNKFNDLVHFELV